MSSDPWAERILMVPVREACDMGAGLVYAIAADPVAAIVFGLLVLLTPLVWKASKGLARQIDRHLPVGRTPLSDDEVHAEFDRIVGRLRVQFSGNEPAQELPDVVPLRPSTPPHQLPHRRPFGMRVLGRRIVRRHIPTSSDRRR